MKYQRTVAGNSLTISDAFNQPVLSLREEDADGVMQITLEGEITADVSHEFEDELTSAATVCKHLKLDFRSVSSICSSGLKALTEIFSQKPLAKRENIWYTVNSRGISGKGDKIFHICTLLFVPFCDTIHAP